MLFDESPVPAPERGDRWRRRIARSPRLFAAAVIVAGVAAWAATGWIAWLTWQVPRELPDAEDIRGIGDMVQATTLYDIHDKPVFAIFKEQRIEVPLDAVAPVLVQAVLSIEDQRFYRHRGVDVVRIAAAAMTNVREGRAAQGGSTITQQLARQSFLTRQKTFLRKLQEVVVSAGIEREFSKAEILEFYLNKVYFGGGFYGVEAAALGYFGKHASELSLDEAALLAGLIKSPSTYAPTVNLERATARRNVVLDSMLQNGLIDRAAHDAARHAPVELRNALQRQEGFGLYFKEHVRRELLDRFGWERVYEGGLRVYTTLDPEMQLAADARVEAALRTIESSPRFERARARDVQRIVGTSGDGTTDRLQAALVALDPLTGEVRALVGGRDFGESKFNRAIQALRQPGSAFKPFVYAAALEEGYTPASLISNLDDPILTQQGMWVPEDEHAGDAALTLRTALRTSSNRAAVHLLQAIGTERGVEYGERLRVGSLPNVPSLALGAGEVTVLSLTAAYGTFSNGGYIQTPTFIRRVEDADGTVLFESTSDRTQVVSPQTAFLMASMLADVVNAGTGYRARAEGFELPAAGKTGTTNDYVDAWFVGFTPALVTGVWIGFDQPRTIMSNGFASDLAVPLWASFMKAATAGDKPVWLERPKGIVSVDVCRLSGLLPSDGCSRVETVSRDGEYRIRSMVYTEQFVAGTQPVHECDLHRRRSFFERLAGTGAVQAEPAPPPRPAPAPDLGSTTVSAPLVVGQPVEQERVEQPEKKRGFFSRMFGIFRGGKDDDKDDRERREERKRRR